LPVEARENKKSEIGMILIDSIFTPIKSVHFDVSNVRVGQLTNFDKLEVFMETDGSIDGQQASDIAAHILVDHFSMMFFGEAAVSSEEVPVQQEIELPAMEKESTDDSEIQKSTLSTRAKNALTKNNIVTLAALQSLSNEEISSLDGLGDKTINEILNF